MKRCRATRLLVVWFLCGIPVVWAHSGKAIIAIRTYTPMTIDGSLEDWVRRLESSNWTGQLDVKKGHVVEWIQAAPLDLNVLTSTVEAGMITSPKDFSARAYFMWDAERFYAAAVVVDDEVVTQHEGADIWQDDALELWLDCRHDAVTHTLVQDDEYQLGVSPASRHRPRPVGWVWRNPEPEPVRAAMEVASSLTPDGYLVELAIPWAVLKGCQPKMGGVMGFNVSMVDKDEDQQWSHITWSGQLHSDPSQFGHLYLVDAPIDLFPSDVFEHQAESSPAASR